MSISAHDNDSRSPRHHFLGTDPLGFTEPPPLYWPLLGLTLLCYVVLTQLVKMWLLRRKWI